MRRISPWEHLLRWTVGLTLTGLVVSLTSGTAVWLFERHAPGANLTDWWDCWWWSIVTLCTVGYGELYPVTHAGRGVAVVVMLIGVALIGAVAAMVAFAFGHRFAERLEAAVRQVETIEANRTSSLATKAAGAAEYANQGLEEVVVPLPDDATAAALTWLLARLGWHPNADQAGLGWVSGGLRIRFQVQPWASTAVAPTRLTFLAGTRERMLRISRESERHGFEQITSGDTAIDGRNGLDGPYGRVIRTASGVEVALACSPHRGWSADESTPAMRASPSELLQ